MGFSTPLGNRERVERRLTTETLTTTARQRSSDTSEQVECDVLGLELVVTSLTIAGHSGLLSTDKRSIPCSSP
jgi:hypothetical protein